jgi:hypothetical protein
MKSENGNFRFHLVFPRALQLNSFQQPAKNILFTEKGDCFVVSIAEGKFE